MSNEEVLRCLCQLEDRSTKIVLGKSVLVISATSNRKDIYILDAGATVGVETSFSFHSICFHNSRKYSR